MCHSNSRVAFSKHEPQIFIPAPDSGHRLLVTVTMAGKQIVLSVFSLILLWVRFSKSNGKDSPATGESFVRTHQRDFHCKVREKEKNSNQYHVFCAAARSFLPCSSLLMVVERLFTDNDFC
jgi:hypothetical protein